MTTPQPEKPLTDSEIAEIRETLEEMRVTIGKLEAYNHPADGPYLDCVRELVEHFEAKLKGEKP